MEIKIDQHNIGNMVGGSGEWGGDGNDNGK